MILIQHDANVDCAKYEEDVFYCIDGLLLFPGDWLLD